MSIKSLIDHLWAAIKDVFHKAEKEVKEVALPIAVKAIDAFKQLTDADQGNMLGKIIAGSAGQRYEKIIKDSLPKIVTELNLVAKCVNLNTDEEVINCALEQIKVSSDRAKNALYHIMAALLLHDLSDGKLTWSECVEFVEFYYKNQPGSAEEEKAAA